MSSKRLAVGFWSFQSQRNFAGKSANRPSQHGLRPPATTVVENIEEVEREINKGKEKARKIVQEVEKIIDSQQDNSSSSSGSDGLDKDSSVKLP
ncbi:hypothetical protein ACHQM5_007320 [Ranunculus cassubicifolius]